MLDPVSVGSSAVETSDEKPLYTKATKATKRKLKATDQSEHDAPTTSKRIRETDCVTSKPRLSKVLEGNLQNSHLDLVRTFVY